MTNQTTPSPITTGKASSPWEKWQEAVANVKVGGPLPIEFKVSEAFGEVRLTGVMTTLDRDTGRRTQIFFNEHYPTDYPWPEECLWRAARECYEHELGEWYTFKDKRIRDPHKDGAR
jgi:hypothetical protein